MVSFRAANFPKRDLMENEAAFAIVQGALKTSIGRLMDCIGFSYKKFEPPISKVGCSVFDLSAPPGML